MKRFFALWLLLWFGGIVPQIHAASALSGEGKLLVTQPRLGAPEWVEIKLTSSVPTPQTGVIEFTAVGDGETAYIYRTREVVVTTGKQTLRFLLPPWPALHEAFVREWRMKFFTDNRATDLGTVVAPPPFSGGRSLILAMVRGSGVEGLSSTWTQLRVENFLKALVSAQPTTQISTAPTAWDPADLPTDPLGYCGFDVVVLEQQALADLREKTRIALRQWVHGGGSLAVIAPASLRGADLEFLDELAAPDPHWKPLAQTPEASALPSGTILTARANYGRLLFAREAPSTDTAETWNLPLRFLWKLHRNTEEFISAAPRVLLEEKYNNDRLRSIRVLEPARTLTLPRSIHMLPTTTLWIAFGLFVLAIGPVDWWVLGRLRARRWTWVLFPLVAAGVTTTLMNLAASSLKNEPVKRMLTITDLGSDGRAVRETRLHISFPRGTGEETLELEGSLATQMPALYQTNAPATKGVPQIAGSFPSRYRFTQFCTQWNPTALRSTRLFSAEDTSQIDWGAIQRGRGNKSEPLLSIDESQLGSEKLPPNWLSSLATLGPRGMSRIAATTSPSGSSLLEDLTCFSTEIPDQDLAIVAQRTPDGVHVWRRLHLR